MAETTKIQWADATMNPWRGCTKVSPGCKFCYAERQSNRNPAVLGVWGPEGTRVLASETKWREVERWNREAAYAGRPHRVFCASLADVFEDWPGQMTDSHGQPLWYSREGDMLGTSLTTAGHADPGDVPYTLNHARERLWRLIRKTPNLTWQLLTKRPENIARMMPSGDWPNVWLGVSVESDEYRWRIDVLADVPHKVPVRFVSAEPLLGPLSYLTPSLGGIRWVIVGGESGGKARPLRVEWVRGIVCQCALAEPRVACFVKQLGKGPQFEHPTRRTLTPLPQYHDPGHGGDPADWPADLNVRQFPD